MKALNFFAATAAFLIVSSATAQQIVVEKAEPYIEVRGSAQTTIAPNRIEIAISLNQADSKGKVSIQEMETSLAMALKTAGIDATKALVLTDQSSAFQKKQGAYQFKNYLLTLATANEVDQVFAAFADNGINNADIVRAWNDKRDQYEQKLKTEAMLNAQKTAQTLTDAVGQKIGRAIQITDYSSSVPMYDTSFAMAKGLTRNAQTPEESPLRDVKFREITIVQSVNVRFALE